MLWVRQSSRHCSIKMKNTLNAIALTMLRPALSPLQLMQLYREVGDVTALVDNHDRLEEVLPEPSGKLKEVFKSMPDALERAQKELDFCEMHQIQPLIPTDAAYPQRLKNCEDAPLVVYYRGNADLNCARVINIVGTRKCTYYGQEIIKEFVRDMKSASPDTLIVSGLAYGVDICAHRNALKNGMKTVGVLAHGLDMIYPSLHRETAKEILSCGGLLTEYPQCTRPDKRNFVQRNRIVAGMSDATVLVESASHGGGLITCGISTGYGRDVYAFPGPVTSPASVGCNNLIRDKGAHLISNAEDFIKAMGWESDAILQQARKEGIQRSMFYDLNPTEKLVVAALEEHDEQCANDLSIKLGMTLPEVNSILFALEMNGIVRSMAGGTYSLV